ncbi:MAG: substrate-binding domain-containing protein, partial [Sedimenticola sp.]
MNKKLSIVASLATATLFSSLSANASDRTVIQNKGSDTLVNVAQAWAEHYREVKPDVALAVSGGGSGTGIAAMINGTVDIANASRKMKAKEIKAAQKKGQGSGREGLNLTGESSVASIARFRCVAIPR